MLTFFAAHVLLLGWLVGLLGLFVCVVLFGLVWSYLILFGLVCSCLFVFVLVCFLLLLEVAALAGVGPFPRLPGLAAIGGWGGFEAEVSGAKTQRQPGRRLRHSPRVLAVAIFFTAFQLVQLVAAQKDGDGARQARGHISASFCILLFSLEFVMVQLQQHLRTRTLPNLVKTWAWQKTERKGGIWVVLAKSVPGAKLGGGPRSAWSCQVVCWFVLRLCHFDFWCARPTCQSPSRALSGSRLPLKKAWLQNPKKDLPKKSYILQTELTGNTNMVGKPSVSKLGGMERN